MKKLISLLIFASVIGFVGQTMATQASMAIGKHNVQIQQLGE